MKKRHMARRLLALLFIVCFCISLIPMTASAATTPYYKTYGSTYQSTPDQSHFQGPPDCYDIYMYGSSTSGSGTLYDGAVLNWNHINVYIDCHRVKNISSFRLRTNGEFYLYDSSVNNTGGASRVLYSGTLPDGVYEMGVSAMYETNILFVFFTHDFHYYFSFTVDTTAPTISGASTSTRYTKDAFTVTASDATSGVRELWYAEPGDKYFKKALSNSVIIPAGSAKGYYHFYAVDNAGNRCDTHYVYYDNERPTGTITNASGTVLTSSYTSGAFKYSGSDSHSGVSYLQYRTPSSSSWLSYYGSTVYTTAADGYYSFRTIDRAGNTSYISGITLDSTAPTGTLYGGSTVVSNGGSTIADYISFVPYDATSGIRSSYVKAPGATGYAQYTSGSQLTAEGTYSFYCVDNAGNTSSIYTIYLLAPSPVSYTVSYNANGGNNAPPSQTKTTGIPLTLTTAQPTRTGYTFLGWSRSRTAVFPDYYSGGIYTTDASVTLYAVWQQRTYTVSYNANGGSGTPGSQIKYYDTPLMLSSLAPTRNNYTFLGWSASSSATSPSYYPGDTFSGNYNLTLYAIWSKDVEVYTVSYDANGGSGAPASQNKIEGMTITLSSVQPTRSGYSFLGWSTSSSSQSVSYAPGSSYTANTSAMLYAVWKYAPEAYTVSYNANGGSNAPASQTKTRDVALTLSSAKPTKTQYTFLGWSTVSTATTAEYESGGSYTENASAMLYAVWQKDNYEFSISGLTVTETDIYRYGTATVKVRADSWDRVNAYSDIPVQLYYDGRLIGTQYVDFAPYGVANLAFTVNVGDTKGAHLLEARINWSDRSNETDTDNNSVTGTFTVKDYEYEMSAHNVTQTSDYYAGTTVITSFTVDNDSDFDITPDLNNNAQFTAYYYSGSSKIVISSQSWNKVVIPSGGTNLVYFKWNVPAGIAGMTVYCECTVNAGSNLNEENLTNNTVTRSTTVKSLSVSQTPNTRYEDTAPGGYAKVNAPTATSGSATWTEWVYEGGLFVLKRYGVKISNALPEIEPSVNCKTASCYNGKYTLRSGYGISLSYSPGITSVSGYMLPGNNAYTSVQNVSATFPEYKYSRLSGEYRTLEYDNGIYHLIKNTDADGDERIHFIPVYVDDGDYTVSVTASQLWTPVGMISATRNANAVSIDGTIYSDWYQG